MGQILETTPAIARVSELIGTAVPETVVQNRRINKFLDYAYTALPQASFDTLVNGAWMHTVGTAGVTPDTDLAPFADNLLTSGVDMLAAAPSSDVPQFSPSTTTSNS